MSLGETLRDARKQAGLSQKALAEALQVSQQTVRNWESGDAVPTDEERLRLDALLENASTQASPEKMTIDPQSVNLACATRFLDDQTHRLQRIALAVLLLLASMGLLFNFSTLSILLWMVIDIVAMALLILVFAAQDPYKTLRQCSVTLTADARTELTGRYTDARPRLRGLLFLGIVCIALGLLLVPLSRLFFPVLADDYVLAGGAFLCGVGAFLCIFTSGLLRTYAHLLENTPVQCTD